MQRCAGTGYDIDYCRVEKLGCCGCKHFEKEENKDEQKIGECSNCKIYQTN